MEIFKFYPIHRQAAIVRTSLEDVSGRQQVNCSGYVHIAKNGVVYVADSADPRFKRCYISDFDRHKIGMYDKKFQFIGFARGMQEHMPGIFHTAWFLCCDSMDHLLVSLDRGRGIYTFDVYGRYISHFDPCTTLSVQFAGDICRGMGDELYIANQNLNVVRSFKLNDQQPRTILSAEHGLAAPNSISCAKSVSGYRRGRQRIAVCSTFRSTVALYAIDD